MVIKPRGEQRGEERRKFAPLALNLRMSSLERGMFHTKCESTTISRLSKIPSASFLGDQQSESTKVSWPTCRRVGTRLKPQSVWRMFYFCLHLGVKYLSDEEEAEDGVEFDTRHITLLLRTHHLARKQNLEREGGKEGRRDSR